MAETDVELRNVKITLKGLSGNFKDYAIHDVTLSAAVNAMPSATVRGTRAKSDTGELMTAEEGATDLSLSALAGLASDDQNKMWEIGDPETLILTVEDDGNGQSMEMVGVNSAPGIAITVGRVLEQRTLVHEDQKISGINMSIYEYEKEWGKQQDMPKVNPNTEGEGPGGGEAVMSKHVFEIMNWILSRTDWNLKNLKHNPDLAEFIEDTHEQNEFIYKQYLSEILERSVDTELYLKSAGDPYCQNGQYHKQLRTALVSGSNFNNTLHNVWCPQFLFQHVCNFDTPKAGSEIMHSQVFAGPSSKGTDTQGGTYHHLVNIDVMSLNYNLGGQLGEMPLGQVCVQALHRTEWGGEQHGVKDEYQSTGGVMVPDAGWPDPKAPSTGEVKQIVGPSWMSNDYTFETPFDVPEAVKQGDVNRAGAGKKNADESKLDVKTKGLTRSEGHKKFLQYWAKKHYTQQSLRNATASVTIPFDIAWGCEIDRGSLNNELTEGHSVGHVYHVSANNADGNVIFLFEGYLRAVTHQITIGEQRGKAVTNLTFTHVKGPNWAAGTFHQPMYGCEPWVVPEM